jgi:peptide chain release factor 1
MSDEVIRDIKRTLELTKEQSSLEEAYNVYKEYQTINRAIDEAKEMLKDIAILT